MRAYHRQIGEGPSRCENFLVTVEWDEEGSSPTPSEIETALQNALRGLVAHWSPAGG
jgi:hypothetical protein